MTDRSAMDAANALINEPLSFGSMIRTIRETDGYTPERLAALLGISEEQLALVESGGSGLVCATTAAAWAEALGYSPEIFVAELARCNAVADYR